MAVNFKMSDKDFEDLPHEKQHHLQFQAIGELHHKFDQRHETYKRIFVTKRWLYTRVALGVGFVAGIIFAIKYSI